MAGSPSRYNNEGQRSRDTVCKQQQQQQQEKQVFVQAPHGSLREGAPPKLVPPPLINSDESPKTAGGLAYRNSSRGPLQWGGPPSLGPLRIGSAAQRQIRNEVPRKSCKGPSIASTTGAGDWEQQQQRLLLLLLLCWRSISSSSSSRMLRLRFLCSRQQQPPPTAANFCLQTQGRQLVRASL
ncbi:hypothetical protein Emag_002148 [Eimeria magna]